MKEVERLEKNREERRARQAEIKEEKKALMNMDPGNVTETSFIDKIASLFQKNFVC